MFTLCSHSVHTLFTLCSHPVHTLFTLCSHPVVHTMFTHYFFLFFFLSFFSFFNFFKFFYFCFYSHIIHILLALIHWWYWWFLNIECNLNLLKVKIIYQLSTWYVLGTTEQSVWHSSSLPWWPSIFTIHWCNYNRNSTNCNTRCVTFMYIQYIVACQAYAALVKIGPVFVPFLFLVAR